MSNQPNSAVCNESAPVGAGVVGVARRRIQWRAWWLAIHLWLGLSVGAVLAVAGVTGSVLVFWLELDEWLNPALVTVDVPSGEAAYRPIGELVAAAERAARPGSHVTYLFGAPHARAVAMIYFEAPSKDWQQVYVDPYRAQVTGVRNHPADEWVPSTLIEAIFRLHFALFLGDRGLILVAIAALLLLLSILSGLVLWWPLTKQWRSAFAIRRPTNPVRLTFDLHKTLSLYSVVVVITMLLSGIFMNWTAPFVWVTNLFSPQTRGPNDVPTSVSMQGVEPIGVERAVAIATAAYPGGRLNTVVVPENPTGAYQIGRHDVPGVSAFWSERLVYVDQFSGTILDVRDPTRRRTAGETFLAWQWPLHSGQAFGMPGRLVVFATGLLCPAIYVTGLLMWWRKRRPSPSRAVGVQVRKTLRRSAENLNR